MFDDAISAGCGEKLPIWIMSHVSIQGTTYPTALFLHKKRGEGGYMQFILAIAPHATTNKMMVYVDLGDEAALNCQTSIITKS